MWNVAVAGGKILLIKLIVAGFNGVHGSAAVPCCSNTQYENGLLVSQPVKCSVESIF